MYLFLFFIYLYIGVFLVYILIPYKNVIKKYPQLDTFINSDNSHLK